MSATTANQIERQGDSKADSAPYLSKSTYLEGLQCSKLLWFRYNAKEEFPKVDGRTKAIFDQGRELGRLAQSRFENALEIEGSFRDFAALIAKTQEALKLRRPLFEAALGFRGAFARADILEPAGRDSWNLIEVKSSGSAKPVHLHDLAVQRFIFQGAGLKIRRCRLLLIDCAYVRFGAVDPWALFKEVDVTAAVSKLMPGVNDRLEAMRAVIQMPAHPDVKIGRHCDEPYTCPLHDRCWSYLPERNVFALSRGRAKAFQLVESGITDIRAIPDEVKLTPNQEIQRRTSSTGEPHVDKAAVKKFLGRIKYPIHFIDFETHGPAIPLFDRSSPYRQIPFQFSVHRLRSRRQAPEHFQFLARGPDDPRREFLERLRDLLGTTGSIVVYNASFERHVLGGCCALHPEFTPWLTQLKARFIDLLGPFRAFHYHHAGQNGSNSMKAVLPALTGKRYDRLAIQDGTTASLEFLRVTYGDVEPLERARVRRQLEAYCRLDTMGMIWILNALRALID